ncbi:MAG: type II CAAX endopeptidase family protein [Methanocellales archaeon]|nr:type II CAAX endopeptidase family protein [Methanocellales archaeon]
MAEEGEKKENRTHIVILALGIIGLMVFLQFWGAVFPTASIDLKLSKEDAMGEAKAFIVGRGTFDLDEYESTLLFSADDSAAVYLQKTLGMERANELMRDELPVWFWAIRWFKPLEKEEFTVDIDPATGEVISFNHELPEDAEGADLSQEKALEIAKDFLVLQGVDLAAFELVKSSSEKRKARTDHHFKWEKKGYKIGEATLRIDVGVHGEDIGLYNKHLKVPESFTRDYEHESSRGMVLALVSMVFMILLVIAALVVFIFKFKKDDVDWRFGVMVGGVVAVLFILSQLNSLPIVMAAYPTFMDKTMFILMITVVALIAALIYALMIFLSGSAGESLSREVLGNRTPVINEIRKRNFFSKELAYSSIRGYSLAFMFLGYITLFYLIGESFFGIWVPASGVYSNILSTSFPFLFPLTIGVLAATSEEFIFRLFAIPLVKKYLKFTVLALVIPAVIWAFAHSSYPVFPVYVRGIELTIAGIIFGYFFLRYDLTTVLIAHYVIDALVVGLPLLKSANTYFLASGLIVVGLALIPAIPVIVATVRRKEESAA